MIESDCWMKHGDQSTIIIILYTGQLPTERLRPGMRSIYLYSIIIIIIFFFLNVCLYLWGYLD